MWWYNRVLMPLGLRFQKELHLVPGMIATEEVDEILLVCLKRRSGLLGALQLKDEPDVLPA